MDGQKMQMCRFLGTAAAEILTWKNVWCVLIELEPHAYWYNGIVHIQMIGGRRYSYIFTANELALVRDTGVLLASLHYRFEKAMADGDRT